MEFDFEVIIEDLNAFSSPMLHDVEPISFDESATFISESPVKEYPELLFENLDLEQYSARVVYDIGSRNTKIMGAIYDHFNTEITAIFSEYSFPMSYSLDLENSQINHFSDLIMEMGLEKLKEYQEKIELDFEKLGLDIELEQYGVATAAFRKAENSENLIQDIKEQLNIPVKVISQHDEGVLGFHGAMALLSNDEFIEDSNPIVWDIGGGSMQITAKTMDGDFTVLQSTTASTTFLCQVLNDVKCDPENLSTPNPFSDEELDRAMNIAAESLKFDSHSSNIISNQLTNGASVYAVGAVHNYSVQKIINKLNDNDHSFYTRDQVHDAVHKIRHFTDSQIAELADDPNTEFANSYVTNLILIHTIMQAYDIDRVYTLKSNNTMGLVMHGQHQSHTVLC